jgi:hypothetical protein
VAVPAAADEVSELKAAVEALQKRIEQLETQAKTTEEANDRQTDMIAQTKAGIGSWVPNFTFRGDLRYRNENIDQEYAVERNRDRIRARAGFVAKVNDTIRSEFALASGDGDPRSSNQTLTGENTRKGIYLDLAYAEWQPHADWKFTAGKMQYPWVRPGQSLFFDGDVNPEGLAANFARGDFFASTFYKLLEERGALGESTMAGGQFGWKPAIGTGRLTLGASYFDLNSVQNRNPFYAGSSNGNVTKTTGCIGGASPCLASDFNMMELFAEWTSTFAGRPVALYADYVKNDGAVNDMDTAWSTGVLYGKASDPRTWEIGYVYQSVEKDALYGQYIDSDWGNGATDANGHMLKFAYAFAKNWTLNTTYMLNKTNMDVATTVSGVGSVTDRDYKRLQVDLNFKY